MPVSKTHPITRRHFLYASGLTLATSALSAKKIAGANETVRLGLIGCGRRSGGLVREFMKILKVEFVAVSDPDTAHMDQRLGTIREIKAKAAAEGTAVQDTRVDKFQDYRKLLEQPNIDAVVVPSTNFWHTLHAIHAVQAGKHVYVEKPSTFKHWEGRQLETAANRYGKVIGIGYQNRSDPGPIEGIRYVQDGNLGKIRKVRANDGSNFPAQVATSHPSESVMHLGNASYRMGELHSSSEVGASIAGNDDLLQILEEQNEQLAA